MADRFPGGIWRSPPSLTIVPAGPGRHRGRMEIIEEARKLDPDRALALAFAQAGDRPLLAALVLFNAELARIPEVVHEPMAGMIRQQWWRDAVLRAAGGGTGAHAVFGPLAEGIAAGLLAPGELLALIDAREGELDRLQPQDLAALEAYADATSGRLHRLMARAAHGDAAAVAAAGRVGAGLALAGIVRAVGFHLRQGRVLLPAALVEREAVVAEDILEARNAEALERVTGAVLARAAAHLDAAAMAGPFARRVMPALLPGRLARRWLRRQRRSGRVAAAPARDGWTVPDLFWGWLVRRI